MNKAVFGKIMENVRKHRDINLVTTERQKNYLENHIIILEVFCRKLIGNKNGKTEILMNENVCLGLSILELSKILMYKFWYDYVKLKHDEKAKLCYIDTDRFNVYI